ncbi:hypothetical protein LIN78_11960 [Leeia sp. TBRC 13508]|uniref:HipA-like kinase domain-containing protein n=1 Tax=Leeia speluncae TaxID=2884804 RepID=A0ABS8D7S3_9NEIS|nr:HipA family kinase [Leeia speluncae]MCB6184259.1 hypothetical protein [Leeia speluncae]
MTIQILEIQRQAQQGMSGPHVCKGEDGHIYYVKGLNSTRRSQIAEWICAHIGTAFGLPIPPFKVVEISELLWEELPHDKKVIGYGPAFGSRGAPLPRWFGTNDISKVGQQTRVDILVFDWWIKNADRSDQNPNLLWSESSDELVVIDHNSAFDEEFSAPDFVATHVFRDEWPLLRGDLVTMEHYREKCAAALDVLDQACNNLPPEWAWDNLEQDIACSFSIDACRNTLERAIGNEFWRME